MHRDARQPVDAAGGEQRAGDHDGPGTGADEQPGADPSGNGDTEGDGDVTRYEFVNIKINAPVAPSRFTLNLPPNTRVEAMKLQ